MNADKPQAAAVESRLHPVIADYLEAVDRGEAPQPEQLIAENPDLAAPLRAYFEGVEQVERMAGPTEGETASGNDRDTDTEQSRRQTVAGSRKRKQRESRPELAVAPEATDLPRELGRYRIVKPLGEGGMGTVYLAHDTGLDRQVALKVPKLDGDAQPDAMERFFREARAAAGLRHRNICPVHDLGEADGTHYISMAYIPGKPISSYVRPEKPPSQRQVVLLVRKLALALQTAHAAGVVHRDLKPSNVILDDEREPVIMDFGLARQVHQDEDARLTKSGMIMGSPAYMSPEQISGDVDKIGRASDIYSLGVMLYELLTGRLPFEGNVTAIAGQILTVEPPKPSEHRDDLDPRLEAICLKMMAKEIGDRHGSMQEVAEALTDFLKNRRREGGGRATITEPGAFDRLPREETASPQPDPRRRTRRGASTARRGVQWVVAALKTAASRVLGALQAMERAGRAPGRAKWIAAALGGAVLLGAITLIFRVDEKLVRVEIGDQLQEADDLQIYLDGNELSLAGLGETIELAVGEHQWSVKRGDTLVEGPEQFVVSDGENEILRIEVEDASVASGKRQDPDHSGTSRQVAESGVEWTDLFNGQDLSGWREYRGGGPVTGWVVENGALHLPKRGSGDIRTVETYRDFELEFEWKISEQGQGNSGVIYRTRNGDEQPHHSGPEYQILNDAKFPNLAEVSLAASLYGLFPAENKSLKSVGQWNTAKIVARGDHLEHWLNGRKVVEAEIGSLPWYEAVSESAFIKCPQYGTVREGHIVLQEHGDPVWYRNIRIREFDDAASGSESRGDRPWRELFNGRELTGWEQHGGEARYSVESGGVIVGRSVPNTPNSFLCTEERFDDFELEFEVQVDRELNSGVQIRSNIKRDDRVYGPQVEIEASPGDAGYIYGEALGGWLSRDRSKTNNFKNGRWNKFRVLASGPRIKTWLNGEPVADLEPSDEISREGFIALQVHGVGGRREPLTVRWRNIRIRELTAENENSAVPDAQAPTRHATDTREGGDAATDQPQIVALDALNNGANNAYPWVSPDGLTIYWTREGPGYRNSEIWTASRPSADAPFGNPRKVLNGRHAVLTGDQREMLYLKVVGKRRPQPLVAAERTNADRSFAEVILVVLTELNEGGTVKSPWLTPDGLTLVFQQNDGRGNARFMITRRTSRSGQWQSPEPIPMSSDPRFTEPLTWPSITSDGRVLFFCHGGDLASELALGTRGSTDEPFGNFQFIEHEDERVIGRSPRYVEATGELFFSGTDPDDPSRIDLKVIRNSRIQEMTASTDEPVQASKGVTASAGNDRSEWPGLQFDGQDDYVEVQGYRFDGSHPVTLEAVVDLQPDAEQEAPMTLFTSTAVRSRLPGVMLKTNGGWWAMQVLSGSGRRSRGGGGARSGRMHVAAVWHEKMQLFIDGSPVRFSGGGGGFGGGGSFGGGGGRKARPSDLLPIVFGAGLRAERKRGNNTEIKTENHFRGKLYELRVSRTARYTGKFRPPSTFEPDEATIALYHVDEESGRRLKDASGNRNDGKIFGATWLSPTVGDGDGSGKN